MNKQEGKVYEVCEVVIEPVNGDGQQDVVRGGEGEGLQELRTHNVIQRRFEGYCSIDIEPRIL